MPCFVFLVFVSLLINELLLLTVEVLVLSKLRAFVFALLILESLISAPLFPKMNCFGTVVGFAQGLAVNINDCHIFPFIY